MTHTLCYIDRVGRNWSQEDRLSNNSLCTCQTKNKVSKRLRWINVYYFVYPTRQCDLVEIYRQLVTSIRLSLSFYVYVFFCLFSSLLRVIQHNPFFSVLWRSSILNRMSRCVYWLLLDFANNIPPVCNGCMRADFCIDVYLISFVWVVTWQAGFQISSVYFMLLLLPLFNRSIEMHNERWK